MVLFLSLLNSMRDCVSDSRFCCTWRNLRRHRTDRGGPQADSMRIHWKLRVSLSQFAVMHVFMPYVE